MSEIPDPRPSPYTVWHCIRSGEYEEAIVRSRPEYEATGSVASLRNGVTALLMLGCLEEARALLEEIIVLSEGSVEKDFVMLGMVQWALHEPGAPWDQWEKGAEAQYSDAAGGVGLWVLWLAHANLGGLPEQSERAREELHRIAVKSGHDWPGILARVALGTCTWQDVVPHFSEQRVLRSKQEVQYAIAKEATNDVASRMAALSRHLIPHTADVCLLQEFHYARLVARTVTVDPV